MLSLKSCSFHLPVPVDKKCVVFWTRDFLPPPWLKFYKQEEKTEEKLSDLLNLFHSESHLIKVACR